MLLLAQQQVLAAEEAREEASRPRFVPASAGGSDLARVQAIRDRQKTRAPATGLLPPPSPTSSLAGERRSSEADAVVGVPTDPATLSARSLGVGGLDEELEEIRRRVGGNTQRLVVLDTLSMFVNSYALEPFCVRTIEMLPKRSCLSFEALLGAEDVVCCPILKFSSETLKLRENESPRI